MVKKIRFLASLMVLLSFSALAISCNDKEDDPFTGIKITTDTPSANPNTTITVTATYYDEDTVDTTKSIALSLSNDTTASAYFATAGTTECTVTSGTSVELTLGSEYNAHVTITATCDSATEMLTVGTTTAISPSDNPIGYAGQDWTSFYDASKVVTVSTKADLVTYAKKGGYTIYVDGMIDMSEGMLPSTGGGTTGALDAFVAENSSYSNYNAWKAVFGTAAATADTSDPLNGLYGNRIRLLVASNTAIIGKTAASGIKGGNIYINGKQHVVLRNLLIQDGYDPFPNHENNDGWNAQQDNVCIRNSKNIWVDHCTLEDTLTLSTAPNGEKWQTYDGLCDITNTSSYVTVSYCIFRNHDKTQLIGSGSSDTKGGYITLCNNYYRGCGQRLPLTAYPNMHIYNNYYSGGGEYKTSYAIGARYAAYTIIAENNYFFDIANAFKKSTGASGKCYTSGNVGDSGDLPTTSTKPFIVPYSYTLISASELQDAIAQNAGVGKVLVN